MDQDIVRFGLAAFVTLLVVVDPPGVVPIFVALTQNQPDRRRAILTRAVLIAFGVALFFLIAGRAVLSFLGVTVHAFSISGGALLFIAALPMLFGERGGLQSQQSKEHEPTAEDISVFPLAMPLLSGPGTIATILLLTSQAGTDVRRLGAIGVAIAMVFIVSFISLYLGSRLMRRLGAIGVAIAVVFIISFISLYLGSRLMRLLGEGGVNIATRVMGIVLAALAVQYVLNGITGYYELLSRR